MKEYILKSDLVEWMYTWFDCDGKKDEKVVRKAIIDKLPTHSFESLDEEKVQEILCVWIKNFDWHNIKVLD